MKKDQKDFVDKSTSDMCDKDACMWSYIGTPTIEARPARLCGTGCKTLIMDLLRSNDTFIARITSRMAELSAVRCHARRIGPHQEIMQGHH